jgi:phage-related protein
VLWYIEFYKTEGGKKPVEEFLKALPKNHEIKANILIQRLSHEGNMLGFPFTKTISGKLKELRIQVSPNTYRIFYFLYTGRKIVLLHAFTKKSQETPRKEIEIAFNRMNGYIRRYKND